MKTKSINLEKILFFILIILPIYKDSPLSLYIGAAGYTIIMPLSLILIILYIIYKQKIVKNEFINKLFFLSIWLTVVSFVGILIWILLGNEATYLEEFLPVKAIKVILQYISFPSYVMLLVLCLRHLDEKFIFRSIYIVVIVLVVINFIEIRTSPYAFQNFHFAATFPYYRVRLLTLEASDTTTLLLTYCGLLLYYSIKYKKKIAFIFNIIAILFFITNTGSKSFIISIGIFIVIYVLLMLKKLRKRDIIIIIFSLILLIIFDKTILPSFINSMNGDIENYTSTATRGYTIFVGLVIGLLFPFGVGGAAYMGTLKYFMNKFLFVFEKLPIEFNLSEIYAYINSNTDVAVTVKSGIMHYNLYWGILGTIYLMKIFIDVTRKYSNLKEEKGKILLALFWTNIILLIFINNFSFEFWIIFAILTSKIQKNDRKVNVYEQRKNSNNIS